MLCYQGNIDSACLRSYHLMWKLSRIWPRLSWVRLWSGWFRFSWSQLGPWLSAHQPYCWPCSTQGMSWCWLGQHLRPLQSSNNGKVVFCISHRLFWYCLSLFALVYHPIWTSIMLISWGAVLFLWLHCLLFMKNSQLTMTSGRQQSCSKVQRLFSFPDFALKVRNLASFGWGNLVL